jgi:hypothetical protein
MSEIKVCTFRFYDVGLAHIFRRYVRWRKKTTGIRKFTEQQALEELLTKSLRDWREGQPKA